MIRFFERERRERELDEEIRIHLEMATNDRVAHGEAREAAELAARREFGDVGRIKAETRAVWGFRLAALFSGIGSPSLALPGGYAMDIGAVTTAPTANDRLKDSFRSWFWGALIFATLVHVAVFALWPELSADVDPRIDPTVLSVIAPPVVEIPPPPQALQRPVAPVGATVDVPDDLTISPTDFQNNPVEKLPPPPDTHASTVTDVPQFTPFEVGPRILNADEVARALARVYPPMLRDAGITGTVAVYFYIDETGRVMDRRLDRTSGVEGLDNAALAAAEVFRFSPAQNRDQNVPVWVSLPITFRVK